MNGPVLTLRDGCTGRVDMTGILPATLAGFGQGEIAAMGVSLDGRSMPLGELFYIHNGVGDTLEIRAETPCLDGLGRNMASGCLRVEGPAGHYAGQGLRGGELHIAGNVGDFAASGMRGGLLRIGGNAGGWLGAALIGERTGMAGGVVAVAGDVGDHLGDRMRRGLVLVGGRAGVACGARMLAGTLVVAGGCGELAGFGLRRGTLILGQAPENLPATFNDSGIADLSWIGLLRLQAQAWLPGVVPVSGRLRRYMGDLAFGGKGEILVPL